MTKKTGFECVQEFHEVFSHPVETSPTIPNTKLVKLRIALILEELTELTEACLDGKQTAAALLIKQLEQAASSVDELTDADVDIDLVEVADALTDINYVTYGAGHVYGLDLDACMQEVQRSNLSKLGEDGKPIYNDKGKIMKGPSYSAPDLQSVLFNDTEKA